MGLIGNEIVQSRAYQYPKPEPEPNLNYKNTFPISVFDAIRRDMNDENSETLSECVERIFNELKSKQPIIPAMSGNYLVTYAGIAGAVGSIKISNDIPWNPDQQSHDRIPTEKAVGNILRKLGLVDDNGNVNEDAGRIQWSDIIGRPNSYDELGNNDDGFMTQRAITASIDAIDLKIGLFINEFTGNSNKLSDIIDSHLLDINNPHKVTAEQIGAVSIDEFNAHIMADNPHHVTKYTVGLDKVDNTSDMDKPVSIATKALIDEINSSIAGINDDIKELNFITDILYDQKSGILSIVYRNEELKTLDIPIDGLVDEVRYDKETKELLVIELGGHISKVDLSDLYVRYVGSVNKHITVIIDENSSKPDSEFREINKDGVTRIWNTNGAGYVDPEPPEIPKETVDNIWDTNGEGYTDPGEGYIKQEKVNDIWESGGAGYTEPDDISNSDNTNSGIHVIRATINPMSITDEEMADGAVTSRVLKDRSVITSKIEDLAITNPKYADESITASKIMKYTISNTRIADRAIDGRTIFSSNIDNRILAVTKANGNPIWTLVTSHMMDDDSVETRNIKNRAVTTEKINERAVTNSKLDNLAVTNEKVAAGAITNEKIAAHTIAGSKIVNDPVFSGVPKITGKPSDTSNNNEVPNTEWVLDRIRTMVIGNGNLGNRIVDGRTLFSSNTKNRVLVVNKANTDPVWGLVNNDMMDDDSVATVNIKDLAVTGDKISSNSILSRHMSKASVMTDHIGNDAVTSEKIFKSNIGNRVLAALSNNGNPEYSQVTRPMIEYNAVGSMQIEDRSVTLSKLQTSDESQRILAVGIKRTDPQWTRVTNGMISERAVDGRTLFTSPSDNMVLAVSKAGIDPAWVKIIGKMISDREINHNHIGIGEVLGENIADGSIESHHMGLRVVSSDNIEDRSITPEKIFTSSIPNRVLAVVDAPYTDPRWMQIQTDMIQDEAVTKEKMMRSKLPYRVLGATQAGVPPEYTMITHQFIVDGTIIPSKLVHDFVLYGHPEVSIHPSPDSNNYQIADTKWVRDTVGNMIDNFSPQILLDTINSDKIKQMIKEAIEDRSIDGTKMFTHPYGPRVLGITKANEDVEFILIEEDLIVDGAVTQNKLQRDIHLLGSPEVEVRPSPFASDSQGGGSQIPDCQWVLDRIAEGGGSSSGSGSGGSIVLKPGCITTELLTNRSVTAPKLFTSPVANRVLGVTSPNTDPQYIQVTNPMIADRSVDAKKLFTSDIEDMILAVRSANADPTWSKITHEMMGDNVIKTPQIVDRSVTADKLATESVTQDKLADRAIIDSRRLEDESVITQKLHEKAVTTPKIADKNVTTEKLADKAVTSEKVADGIILPKDTTIEPNSNYESKAIRNIILSSDKPTGGSNGDIWFRYI